MDSLEKYPFIDMPARIPLGMRTQDFKTGPSKTHHIENSLAQKVWRLAAFAPALAITIGLLIGFFQWFEVGGVSYIEGAAIALIGVTFIWISFAVTQTLVALCKMIFSPRKYTEIRAGRGEVQNVALLVPIYNESTSEAFGNLQASLKDLAKRRARHTFTAFILSDSFDEKITSHEEQLFSMLKNNAPDGIEVYYRRRGKNTDKKVGNLNDWITNWGGGYDAMLVLDADSLMSGSAILHLTRALAQDEQAGLIQSFPMLIGAKTLFARLQEFSNTVYGWLLAEGLSVWSQSEGNYWGHNAIIRTKAFASSAKLPYLKSRSGKEQLILSHDFVEAGMLRRAGWSVRFLPQIGGSFEESPPTLIDYVIRDRRWCRGNLQHLRLLGVRGFHPITRFYMLQGAVAFLLSPAWLLLIFLWSSIGMAKVSKPEYFSDTNPLFPMWPELTQVGGMTYLILIYSMLLLPKLTGLIALLTRSNTRQRFGGSLKLVTNVLFEIICSILYAPIMMIQHTKAVFWAILGRTAKWEPQNRGGATYSWKECLLFHYLETILGVGLVVLIISKILSFWLLPIAVSLALATALSKLSACTMKLPYLKLDTPHSLNEPRIFISAKIEKQHFETELKKQNLLHR